MPIIAIPPPPYGLYQPGTPGFAQLVSDALGNTGTAADGFDAALAATMAVVTTTDAQAATSDTMIAALSAAADTYNAITDEISAELEAATLLYDASESGLLDALVNLGTLGNGPAPASLDPLPGLPNIAIPAAVDVTQLIASVVSPLISSAETDLISLFEQYVNSQPVSVGTGLGPGGGPSQWYYI